MKKLTVIVVILLISLNSLAGDGPDKLTFKGLLEVQLPVTDGQQSSLSGGMGKFRFDESDNRSLKLGSSGINLNYQIKPSLGFRSSILYYPESHGNPSVTEAFLHYRPVSKSAWRQAHKIGAFYPSLSLENRNRLWTPTETLTPSVINSWVGEEVRTLGIESRWTRQGRFFQSPHDFSLFGAIFMGNDTNGALLAWRGWSNTDRQTGIGERLPLADLPNLMPGGAFDGQARNIEPFVELDNRPGFYLGGEWQYDRRLKVTLKYYDNQAKSTEFDAGQYGWHTAFTHTGISWEVNRNTRLVAQYLSGETEMNRDVVQADFDAAFIMLSHRMDKHRFAIRWERFAVEDRDQTVMDSNNEFGHSFTLAYRYPLTKKLTLSFQGIRERSNRMARRYFDQPEEVTESQFLASLQYAF